VNHPVFSSSDLGCVCLHRRHQPRRRPQWRRVASVARWTRGVRRRRLGSRQTPRRRRWIWVQHGRGRHCSRAHGADSAGAGTARGPSAYCFHGRSVVRSVDAPRAESPPARGGGSS